MLKISNVNYENVGSAKGKKSFAANNSKAVPSMRCNPQLAKSLPVLSQEHLKANFAVNFGARLPIRSGGPGFSGFDDDEPSYHPPAKVREITFSKEDINPLHIMGVHELHSSNYYAQTADDVVALIAPKKNALLLHDEYISDELLTHKFMRNLKDGRYAKAGFEGEKTDVYVVDAKRLLKTHKLFPDSIVSSLADQKDGRKRVIFVKNFDHLLLGMLAHDPPLHPEDLLGEGKLHDAHIVGLLPKKMYNDIMEPSRSPVPGLPKTPFKPEHVSYLGTANFDGMSPAATKDLLKKDARQINSVINRYDHSNLLVTDKALDELVDKSSSKLEGAFPQKALKALDLAVALKLETPTHHQDGSENVVTSTDIKKLFEDHNELLDSLSVRSGQFKVAENVKTRLSDVGGIKEIKDEIEDKILSYIREPKKYLAGGQTPPKGILMHGEPGTGKTLIARAVAGEAGVPFIATSGSEFVETFVGLGAKRVREVFELARSAAAASEKKTAILFIDEVDAIAKKRSSGHGSSGGGGGESETERTLNELLTQMDGFNNKESKVKVIVMAATNRADMLDDAFKRPGRFDSVIEVPAPSGNIEAREEILAIHAKGKPFASAEERAKIVKEAAAFTDGMSGAELADVFAKAAGVVAKRPDNKVITHNDVVEGYLRVKAGPIKKSPSEFSAEHGVKTVRHEGGHAVAIETLKHLNNEKISFVTLEPRGNFLGAVYYHKTVNDLPNFHSVIASMAVDYAGGIAEPSFKDKGHAAGVSGDLKAATNLIENAVTKWGLGVHTPQISLEKDSPLYKVYEHEIKKDTELFSSAGQKVAKMIVDFHKGFLDEYIDKYKANTGKGGNNLSGEEFSKLHREWLSKTGNKKKFLALQKRINKIIVGAQNSNKSFVTKAKDSVVRAFRLAA